MVGFYPPTSFVQEIMRKKNVLVLIYNLWHQFVEKQKVEGWTNRNQNSRGGRGWVRLVGAADGSYHQSTSGGEGSSSLSSSIPAVKE